MSLTRNQRAGARALAAGAFLAVLALLAGCGVRADHTADAGEGDAEATLPTLPPVEERLAESYDADGCLILSQGVDCGGDAGGHGICSCHHDSVTPVSPRPKAARRNASRVYATALT